MLTLTENASAIVKAIVDQQGAGEDGGIRFSNEGAQDASLNVTTTPQPEPGDKVVESEGAKVFLDEGASVALDGQVLDANVDPQGAVQFSIAPGTPPQA